VYNTTNACIIYLGLLRGSNDLTVTTGGSLAWNSDANTLATFSSLCELTMMCLSFLLEQLVRLHGLHCICHWH